MKLRIYCIKLINIYQKIFSPDTGFFKKIGIFKKPSCVFYPTCSEYTKEAILKYGIGKGFYLGFLRILRCHPWQKKHIDSVQ